MSSDAHTYSLLRNYMSLHRDLFAIKVNLTHAGKPWMTQQNTYRFVYSGSNVNTMKKSFF